ASLDQPRGAIAGQHEDDVAAKDRGPGEAAPQAGGGKACMQQQNAAGQQQDDADIGAAAVGGAVRYRCFGGRGGRDVGHCCISMARVTSALSWSQISARYSAKRGTFMVSMERGRGRSMSKVARWRPGWALIRITRSPSSTASSRLWVI